MTTLEEVEAWLLEDPVSRIAGNAGLREDMRRWLVAPVDAGKRGGRVALVCGDVGCGKTLFVKAALQAAGHGGVWIHGPSVEPSVYDRALRERVDPINDMAAMAHSLTLRGSMLERARPHCLVVDDVGSMHHARGAALRKVISHWNAVRFVLVCDAAEAGAVGRKFGAGGIRRFPLGAPDVAPTAALLGALLPLVPDSVRAAAEARGLKAIASAAQGDVRAALVSFLAGANAFPPAASDRAVGIGNGIPRMMEGARTPEEVDRVYRLWPDRMPGLVQKNVGGALARQAARAGRGVGAGRARQGNGKEREEEEELRGLVDLSRFADALSDGVLYLERMPWVGDADRISDAVDQIESMMVLGRPCFSANLRSRVPAQAAFNTEEASCESRLRNNRGTLTSEEIRAKHGWDWRAEDWGLAVKVLRANGEDVEPALARVVDFRTT